MMQKLQSFEVQNRSNIMGEKVVPFWSHMHFDTQNLDSYCSAYEAPIPSWFVLNYSQRITTTSYNFCLPSISPL